MGTIPQGGGTPGKPLLIVHPKRWDKLSNSCGFTLGRKFGPPSPEVSIYCNNPDHPIICISPPSLRVWRAWALIGICLLYTLYRSISGSEFCCFMSCTANDYMGQAIPVQDEATIRRGQVNKAAADDGLAFDFNTLLTDAIQRTVKSSVIDGDRLTLEETVGQGTAVEHDSRTHQTWLLITGLSKAEYY